MSSAYQELLDATIQHLENLKARGVRHVAVAPETLRALALPAKSQIQPVATAAPVSNPARTDFSKQAGPEAGAPQAVAPKNFQPAAAKPFSQNSQSLLTSAAASIGSSAVAAPPLDPQAKAAAFAA